jgi:OmpA family/Outer membrane protein beta-barrel domain
VPRHKACSLFLKSQEVVNLSINNQQKNNGRIMKKIFFLAMLFPVFLFAQVYHTKWGIEGGLTYPRYFSVSGQGYSEDANGGVHVSIERFFNEYLSLRVLGNYLSMESVFFRDNSNEHNLNTVHLMSLNLDACYRFLPCELISPYFVIGIGMTNFKSNNPLSSDLNKWKRGYQGNLGLGIDWGLTKDLSLMTEAVYVTSSDNKIDGNYTAEYNSKGLLGGDGDTYVTLNVGIKFWFGKGDTSNICDKCCPQGITDNVGVGAPPPLLPITDTIYITKTDTMYFEKPYLFGINFDFDKYNLLPETYPVLDHAVDVLNKFKNLDVIIIGNTDSMGSNEYNMKLSKKRVDTVLNYLLEKGIAKSRITEEWKGEENPIKDNSTAQGRAFNRRVEIRIK